MGIEDQLGYLSSAQGIVAIDVSAADQVLAKPCRAIMVGVTGNVAVQFVDGTTGILPGLLPGGQYAVAVNKFFKTGTTATGIVALL